MQSLEEVGNAAKFLFARSPYHWLEPRDPIGQMRYCKAESANAPFNALPVIDYEHVIHHNDGSKSAVPVSELLAAVDETLRLWGISRVIVYTGAWYLRLLSRADLDRLKARQDILWLWADYRNDNEGWFYDVDGVPIKPQGEPYRPKGFDWAGWQFTSTSHLEGILDRTIDLDCLNVLVEDLLIENNRADKVQLVDVWKWMCGDGTPYMVDVFDKNGKKVATERYQHQVEGNRVYIVKNQQFECYELVGNMIRQVRDTSPDSSLMGTPHYYDVTGGMGYAPRYMYVGQTWREPIPHDVDFYDKRTGHWWVNLPSGVAHNEVTLFSADDDGIRIGREGGEIHYFGVHGRHGWESAWGSARLSSDTTGDYPNVRETVAEPQRKRSAERGTAVNMGHFEELA